MTSINDETDKARTAEVAVKFYGTYFSFGGRLIDFTRRYFDSLVGSLTPTKALNVGVALVEYALGRQRTWSRPFVVRVDPSTVCNLRCPNCEAHTEPQRGKRLLDFETFLRLVDRIRKFCIRLSLYDTGEPLVNRNLFSMIRVASESRMSTCISTNLTLFRAPRHLSDLFDSGLATLSVSADGITQESYQKYRVRGDLSKVIAALRSIVAEKRSRGSGPLIEVQVLDLDHLRPDRSAISEYFNALGVDRVTWKQEAWGYNANKTTQSHGRCFWLYMGAMVRPDGNVFPCGGKGFDRFSYGNLIDQSFDEIWNNIYYRYSRSLFQSGPDLPYDERMKDLPCHSCDLFTKKRRMFMKVELLPGHHRVIPLHDIS